MNVYKTNKKSHTLPLIVKIHQHSGRIASGKDFAHEGLNPMRHAKWRRGKGVYVYVQLCACIYCVVTGVGVHGSIRVAGAALCACAPPRPFQNKRPDALFYARQVVAFVFYFCRRHFSRTLSRFFTTFFHQILQIFANFYLKSANFHVFVEVAENSSANRGLNLRNRSVLPPPPPPTQQVSFFCWLPRSVFSWCPPFRLILHTCVHLFNVPNTCILDKWHQLSSCQTYMLADSIGKHLHCSKWNNLCI